MPPQLYMYIIIEKFKLLIIWDMAIYYLIFRIHVLQEPLEMRMSPLIRISIKETTHHH